MFEKNHLKILQAQKLGPVVFRKPKLLPQVSSHDNLSVAPVLSSSGACLMDEELILEERSSTFFQERERSSSK